MTEHDNTEVLYHDDMDAVPQLERMPFGELAIEQAEINRKRDEAVLKAKRLEFIADKLLEKLTESQWQEASKLLRECRSLLAALEATK